jgi:uncharacterized protein YaiE (UPF0345 family)
LQRHQRATGRRWRILEALAGRVQSPKIVPFIALTPRPTMTTTHFDGVTVATQASVYFDGKCISHGITLADGTKKSVGVVLPATLTFNTGAPEIMECVAGGCEYKLKGTEAWLTSGPGNKFSIPGNSSFDIRVTETYHYICHFG